MDCSMPGFPAHHQLLEPSQTHVYHIGDAIRPSHPLSSPSPPPFSLSQHHGLFQLVSFSFSISPSNEYSGLISFRSDWISLKSKGLWRVFSNTTVQKHQFFINKVKWGFIKQYYTVEGRAGRLRWVATPNFFGKLVIWAVKVDRMLIEEGGFGGGISWFFIPAPPSQGEVGFWSFFSLDQKCQFISTW